ncbi:methyl-accepting chemotaxis protein [Fredinandcohnia humi]
MFKLRNTVLGKSLLFSIIIVITVGLASALMSYFIQQNITRNMIEERAEGIAKLWNSTFELDDIVASKGESDVESDVQQRLISQLDKLTALEPSVAQGYIFDGEFANEKKEVLMLATPQNIIDAGLAPGTIYKISSIDLENAYEQAIDKNEPAHTEIYSDEFGTWQSVVIPITDQQGEIVAVFGVDIDASVIHTQRNTFLLWLGIGIGLALLVVSILQYFVFRKMLSPIASISNGIKEVSNGNLNTSIDVKTKDELGQLSIDFNQMISNLRNLLIEVNVVNESVNASSKEFLMISQETTTTTSKFASTLEEVSSSLEEQSRSSLESAKAMEEIAIGIQRAAESSSVVSEKSEVTLSETLKGKEQIMKAIQQMNNITETVGATAYVIKKLGERSKEIGNIVSVISSISEQTNLLALNAAIEAARAGDYGRGFAVVADEVRKLAEQSQTSAHQIAELILSTQHDTDEAVDKMEKGTLEVKNGESLISSLEVIMNEIVTATENVSSEIQEISAILEEMSASSEEINATVDEISTVATKSVKVFDGLVSDSQEQIRSMKDMDIASNELVNMVDSLDKKIKYFTI